MKYTVLLFLFISTFLASCGTKKNADEGDIPSNTKLDYAYIEKFHKGVRLKSKGENKEAITVFQECLALKANDDAVHFALSQLYMLDGNLIKSGEAIQKAAEIDPGNLHYVSELAYYYTEQNRYDLAAEQFAKLVESDPRNAEYSYPYAECLARSGKYAEAINQLDKTQDLLGLFPEIALQKFQLYQQLKQPEKGLIEIEKARETYPDDPQLMSALVDYYLSTGKEEKAMTMLETLAAKDDANGRVQMFLADMYRRRGDMDKFYAASKKAMAGKGVELEDKTKFLSSLQKSGQKTDPRAMELAEAFALAHPNQAQPYSVLGDFYLSNEDEANALVNYRKALKYEKGASSLWNQVLLMEYQAADIEHLAEDSEESLKYFPTLPTFYLLNGVANIQLKKHDKAISSLKIGKEYITNDKSLKAEFYGQLGEAYFAKKDYKKGKEWYEKALVADPISSLLLNNYAYRLAVSKIELSKAENLAIKAIGKAPNQANFVDTYAFVLFQNSNYSDALVQFEKAFKMDDEDKVTAEHLGDVHYKLNNKREAQKFWLKAKELGGTSTLLDKKISNSTYYEAE